MEQETKQSEIKWFAPDSSDGERTLSQHGYYGCIRNTPMNYPGPEKYNGNKSLCGKSSVIGYDTEPLRAPIESIPDEPIGESCCKSCLKIFNKLKP